MPPHAHTYTDTHVYTVLSTKRIHGLMAMLTYGQLGGSWRLIKSAVTCDHGATDVTKAADASCHNRAAFILRVAAKVWTEG